MRAARRRTGILGWLGLALGFLLLLYFAFYALYGGRGLLAQRRLEQDVIATQEKLNELRAEREQLQKKTDGLRPESLDADLIEQQAREQLGLTREGEQVIVTPPVKKNN